MINLIILREINIKNKRFFSITLCLIRKNKINQLQNYFYELTGFLIKITKKSFYYDIMTLLMNHEKSYSIIQRETQSLQDLMLSKAYSIIVLSNKYNDSYKNSVNNFIDSTCSSYSINKKQIFQQHDINNEIRFNFLLLIQPKIW